MKRGKILEEAAKVINGERQDQYGNPEDSFCLIAKLWSLWLGVKVNSKDVAMCMTLLKIARQKNQDKRDNLVDAIGYLGILADMQEVEIDRKEYLEWCKRKDKDQDEASSSRSQENDSEGGSKVTTSKRLHKFVWQNRGVAHAIPWERQRLFELGRLALVKWREQCN